MLVLSRNQGSSIIIGNNEVKISILDIKNGQVKIGVEAPKNISVHRQEIYNLIQDKQKDKQYAAKCHAIK